MNYNKFLRNLKIKDASVYFNYDVKHLTSFKIGGKVKYFVIVKNEKTLKDIISFKKKYFIIGGGTNVLFNDTKLNITLIKLGGVFKKIRAGNEFITAGAGSSLYSVNKKAKENNLSGLEFSYGIPGSVGGAVFGNAGAFDNEILNAVASVKILNKNKIYWESNFSYSYRDTTFKKNNSIILCVKFKLLKKCSQEIEFAQKQFLEKRMLSQPYNKFSAGSVFKRVYINEQIFYPAKIIDKLGLKGVTIGGAKISEKHAGFIINENNAKFKDVLKLIKIIKKTVYKNNKLKLKEEIIIVGGKFNVYFRGFSHPHKIFKTQSWKRNNNRKCNSS